MADIDRELSRYVRDRTPESVAPFGSVTARTRRRTRTRRMAAALGAGVVMTGGGVWLVTGMPDGGADVTRAADTTSRDAESSPGATDERTGPLDAGGAMSCVEEYTAQAAVNRRAFAFDGTVTAIGPGTTDRPGGGDLDYAAVTFAVAEWFAGGSASEVTIDMSPPNDDGAPGPSAELGPASYGVGTRLLVSGEPRWGGPALDDAIAWGCGFTRYYDEATGDAWRAANQ